LTLGHYGLPHSGGRPARCESLSFLTKKIKTDNELIGLVYSMTPRSVVVAKEWYNRPVVLASIVGAICLILSIIFW